MHWLFTCFTGCVYSLHLECSVPEAQLWHETSHFEDPQWAVFSGSFLNSQYSWIWGMHLELNKLLLHWKDLFYSNFWKKIFVTLCQKSSSTFYFENILISLWTFRSKRLSTHQFCVFKTYLHKGYQVFIMRVQSKFEKVSMLKIVFLKQ